MKIIVLGGAGDMGSKAVEDLAMTDGVELVTIADRNVTGAHELARKLEAKGAKADARQVNAHNHEDLVNAMKGYDVAASTLGPFHMFEAKLVRAALDAEVDYASICDEWEAAEAVMNEFGKLARERGRTVITGLGTSPGLSNVGVRFLADQFEKLRKVDIYVFQPLEGGGGEAVVRHMFHIMTGDIAVWRGGKRTVVKALSEEREVEFPRYGRMKTWNMGHSEPATVPMFFPDIEEVNFFMGFGKGAGAVVKPAKWGLFNGRGVREVLVRVVNTIERLAVKEPEWGAVKIEGHGIIDGREETRMVCGIGQMREATGLSLSVGALMLARKQLIVEEPGIYAPEACIDPRTFIGILGTKGIQAFEDMEMTKRIE